MNGQARTSLSHKGSPTLSDTGATGYAPSSLGTPAPEDAEMKDVKPERLSTQLAIQGILKTGPLSFDQIRVLSKIEVRKLPTNFSADARDPERVPRTCCFDAASSGFNTWTSNKLCPRCSLLNQVLQDRASGDESAIIRGIWDSAFICTDCSSETQRTGKTTSLPPELLDSVIKYAIDEMRKTSDGDAVQQLLHVSTAVRLQVVEAFAPIRLLGLHPPEPHETHELYAPGELEDFLWESIHWYLFRDFSQKPQQKRNISSPAICAAPAISDSLEVLSTRSSSQSSTYIYLYVKITPEGHRSPTGKKIETISWGGVGKIGYDKGEERVDVRDGCEAAQAALGHVMKARFKRVPHFVAGEGPFVLTSEWIRFANPYYRAMHGSFGPPATGAEVLVSCWLHNKGPDYEPTVHDIANKSWLFETEVAY